MGRFRPLSSLNRSIQSQKLNLTDDQRRNLSQLREKILSGQILAPAAASSPSPPDRDRELKNQSA
uniref:Uncharacterized protein n=1 Tax=Romanomermis culicivorax TaxID=13658 RepID=A0A915IV80_ROMCU